MKLNGFNVYRGDFMQDMPKYVLKNKRLSRTKTVFIFRRNYLDIKDFIKIDGGWIFEEEFTHHGNKCYFYTKKELYIIVQHCDIHFVHLLLHLTY